MMPIADPSLSARASCGDSVHVVSSPSPSELVTDACADP